MRFIVQGERETWSVDVEEHGGRYFVEVREERFEVDARVPRQGSYSLLIGGISYLVDLKEENGQTLLEIGGETFRLRVEEALRARLRGQIAPASRRGGQVVKAPMPGRVVGVLVGVGDQVKAGTGLIVIEAMKMENELRAVAPGEVKEVRVAAGAAVSAGQILIVIE